MNLVSHRALQAQHTAVTAAPTAVQKPGLFGTDGFTFGDLIDLVNPLQHIPVVSSYYRKWTGDTIAPAMRIAGGALFGGPVGAGLATVGMLVEDGLRAAFDRPGPDPAPAAPPTAVAARPTVAPGGWLVAVSRQVAVDPFATRSPEATTAARQTIQPRPGGWMVAASYAMSDDRLRRHAATRQIDTAV